MKLSTILITAFSGTFICVVQAVEGGATVDVGDKIPAMQTVAITESKPAIIPEYIVLVRGDDILSRNGAPAKWLIFVPGENSSVVANALRAEQFPLRSAIIIETKELGNDAKSSRKSTVSALSILTSLHSHRRPVSALVGEPLINLLSARIRRVKDSATILELEEDGTIKAVRFWNPKKEQAKSFFDSGSPPQALSISQKVDEYFYRVPTHIAPAVQADRDQVVTFLQQIKNPLGQEKRLDYLEYLIAAIENNELLDKFYSKHALAIHFLAIELAKKSGTLPGVTSQTIAGYMHDGSDVSALITPDGVAAYAEVLLAKRNNPLRLGLLEHAHNSAVIKSFVALFSQRWIEKPVYDLVYIDNLFDECVKETIQRESGARPQAGTLKKSNPENAAPTPPPRVATNFDTGARLTSVGKPATKVVQISVSPDGMRIGWVAMMGSRLQVTIDGEAGTKYDEVLTVPVCDPKIGTRVNYAQLWLGNKGRRSFYSGRNGDSHFAIIDGVESPPCDGIVSFSMSPDGSRVAYSAKLGRKITVFLDGNESSSFDLDRNGGGHPMIVFSADGKHFAAAGLRGGKPAVDLDGLEVNVPLPAEEQSEEWRILGVPAFTAISNRLLYILAQEGNYRGGPRYLVVDKQLRSPKLYNIEDIRVTDNELSYTAYDKTGQIFVSNGQVRILGEKRNFIARNTDGRRVMFIRRDKVGSRESIEVNAESGPEFEEVMQPGFTADGSRYSYIGLKANQYFVVVDGNESEGYQSITTTGTKNNLLDKNDPAVIFSPKGDRYAFAAVKEGGVNVVIIDGREVAAYGGMLPHSLVFSENGQRLAYIVSKVGVGGGSHYLVVDGVETLFPEGSRPHEFASGIPCFSPDGKRVAHTVVFGGNREQRSGMHWIIDGKITEDDVSLTSDGGIKFSPDSRHYAYYAHSGQLYVNTVVVDGMKGPRVGSLGNSYNVLSNNGSGFGALVFRDDGEVEYLGIIDGEFFLIKQSFRAKPVLVADTREIPTNQVVPAPDAETINSISPPPPPSAKPQEKKTPVAKTVEEIKGTIDALGNLFKKKK